MPNTHPEHSIGTKSLPPQVEQYLAYTKAYEEALKKKDIEAIAKTRRQIEIFLGLLTEEEQKEIERFLEQESAGLRIRDYQLKTRGFVGSALRGTVSLSRNVAETLPLVAEHSATAIGGVIGGAIKGFSKAYRKFKNAA